MILDIEFFILGFLIGSIGTYIYEEIKDKQDDKQTIVMYKERIKCLEEKIKELSE